MQKNLGCLTLPRGDIHIIAPAIKKLIRPFQPHIIMCLAVGVCYQESSCICQLLPQLAEITVGNIQIVKKFVLWNFTLP